MRLQSKPLNGSKKIKFIYLKLVVGSIVILSLVVFFLFALFPSTVSVTRMVQIQGPEVKIVNKIADLRTWKTWNEFVLQPEESENRNKETDSVQADYLRFRGNQISVSGVDTNYVKTRWTRGNKMFVGEFVLDKGNGSQILIWTMNFNIKWYPWEKLASMFYDKQLGPVMERSLIRLRDELEKGR